MPEKEFCSERTAKALAKQIEEFWAARGGIVVCEAFQREFHPSLRMGRWDIRSDLRNGLPVRKTNAIVAA